MILVHLIVDRPDQPEQEREEQRALGRAGVLPGVELHLEQFFPAAARLFIQLLPYDAHRGGLSAAPAALNGDRHGGGAVLHEPRQSREVPIQSQRIFGGRKVDKPQFLSRVRVIVHIRLLLPPDKAA